MRTRRPLRIVHVAVTDRFAGVERSVALTARSLAERGHEVTVLGGRARDMSLHLGPSQVQWLPARTLPEAIRRLAAVGRVDVVHAHMTNAELAAAVTRPLHRGSIVLTRHFAQPRGLGRGGAVARRIVERVPRTEISISDYTAARIGGESVVVYHGVPNDDAAPLDARSVLIAQRLEAEKDTLTALRAWDLAGLGDEGWTLLVAGEGAERPALERTAATLNNPGSVRFLGHVQDVQALRRQSAVQIATPRTEHFGLSVAEAMACGLPVVAADGGAHREVLGASMDLTSFPPGDAAALAEVLRRLADDPSLRAKLGVAVQERQRSVFSLEHHADRIEAVYEGCRFGTPTPR